MDFSQLLSSRPLCTKRPPKKRWTSTILYEQDITLGVVLYAEIESPPNCDQYLYFLEIVHLVGGLAAVGNGTQPPMLGHVTCEVVDNEEGGKTNIMGTFEKGKHLQYGGDYPTLEDWLPVALAKAFAVANHHFPEKQIYGEWTFHHDFDPKMVLPEIPQDPLALIIMRFQENGKLNPAFHNGILEGIRVSQEGGDNFTLHDLMVMMVSGFVGEELSAMETVMHLLVYSLRRFCLAAHIIPVTELTESELEEELTEIWCEKYNLSKEAGLNEAQLMMGKLGLVPCQNYILQYRESKNDPTDDALKPIAELTDDETIEEIVEFFTRGKTEFYQTFYQNFSENSGIPNFEGDIDTTMEFFCTQSIQTIKQLLPGLRKIKATNPWTEDEEAAATAATTATATGTDEVNPFANSATCVQCGQPFVADSPCQFPPVPNSKRLVTNQAHRYAHHTDYAYANFFAMALAVNDTDGDAKQTHKLLGLLIEKKSEPRPFCKVAKVLKTDPTASPLTGTYYLLQIGSIVPNAKFWFHTYSAADLKALAQEKPDVIFRATSPDEGPGTYSLAKWIYTDGAITGVHLEVKSRFANAPQTLVVKFSLDTY